MPGNEEIPRNFNAPEILVALKQLQIDLAATRADIRTVADRQGVGSTGGAAAGGETVGTAGEVQATTAALGDESAARARNISLAGDELVAQREITAAVEQTALMYAKLSETRAVGGATAVLPSMGSTASAAETRAALTQRIQAPVPMVAPVQERVPPTAALGSYSQELTNVSARQAEFTAVQMQGGAANAQFMQNLARGDVTLSEFGSQLGSTVGKFAQWTAAAAGIFAVIGLFTELYKGAKESSSGVDQLKRSIDGLDTEKAAVEIRALAHGLNIPIDEASEAIFKFSRTFPTLEAAVAAAGVGLKALKVDNVALTESVPALTQVHQQFGISAQGLSGFFDMLDAAQRRYNARVSVTLAATQKSAAAMKDAGATLEQLVQIETYAARVTGQPGAQIGTALYRAASNFVQQPKAQNAIQNLGLDPHEASTEIGKFLLNAIKVAQDKSPQWRRELAIAIGGKQQGGKVFEPLLSGTDPKLLAEITTGPHAITPDKAKGSTQQELLDILEKPSERVKALKLDLEQLGGAFQSAGALAGPGVLLVGLTDSLNVVKQLLEGFNMLPKPVKELLSTLLEVSLVMKGLRATAFGTGLASATGLGFLGPSQATLAGRAERQAQESSLAGVTGMQGSTIAREQSYRMQAAINEQGIKLAAEEEAGAATAEERAGIKARVMALEAENVQLSQEGNLLLQEQEAQQALANDLQMRINALRAGAQPAAGFFPGAVVGGSAAAATARGAAADAGAAASSTDVAELVGGAMFAKIAGIPAMLSGLLSTAMKGAMVGVMADIAAQMGGQMLGGSAGKMISGHSTEIGMGAGVGFMMGGPVGAGLGAVAAPLLVHDASLIKEAINGPKPPDQTGLIHAMASFKDRLGPEVLKAQAGELSPEKLKEVQATLSSMINDPGFAHFNGALREMQTQLSEVTKGTTDASRALAQTRQFGRYENIQGKSAAQIGENVSTAALSATTIGASKGNVTSLTHDFEQLANQYGGGGNKEALTKLKESETKLLEAAKKNAEDLADKAKVDPSISGKTTDYKAAISGMDNWTKSVQGGYRDLSKKLKGEEGALKKAQGDQKQENTINRFFPGSSTSTQIVKRDKEIAELEEGVKNNKTEAGRLKKATEYETNQLKAARHAAAESAFTDISNAIDAKSGLAEAQTTDKSVQLADALRADNEKLKLALELFHKKSIEYEKALTESLKAQQSIVEQSVTNIDVAGKLSASQVSGTGVNQDIQRAQINLGAMHQELQTLKVGRAEPNKIRGMETQINEAETALGANMLARAKTIITAKADLAKSQTLNPLVAGRIDISTDTKLLALAKSPEEKDTAQAALNNAKHTWTATLVSQRERDIAFHQEMKEITKQQAIQQLQELEKLGGISTQVREELRSKIRNLEKGANNNQVFSLAPGSIKLPTALDVQRAAGEAVSRAGGFRPDGGLPVVNRMVRQQNTITINVHDPHDAAKVGEEIERITGGSVNTRLRKAGLRGS